MIFTPQGAGYAVQAVSATFDQGAGAAQAVRIGDDDSIQINLPFAFPLFGVSYNSLFVNSDGNLTFSAPDFDDSDRDLNRLVKGPQRIAGFLDDLVPVTGGGAGLIYAEGFSDRVIFYWIGVLEYPSFATTTFEIVLAEERRH